MLLNWERRFEKSTALAGKCLDCWPEVVGVVHFQSAASPVCPARIRKARHWNEMKVCEWVGKNYVGENQRKEYLWLKTHNHVLLVQINYRNATSSFKNGIPRFF